MNPHSHSSRASQRGVALIITLFFLVIVSIVAIGFLDTARLDRTAAGSHFERMRAGTMAQAGIENVAATLQRETGDAPFKPSDPDYIPRNWVSQPGSVSVTDPATADRTRLMKKVPLSSGLPSAPYLDGSGIELVLRPPNLNSELLVDQSPPTHLLSEHVDPATGNAVQMKVRWMYVRKDGTYELDANGLPVEAPVTTDKINPIVGRFAYWTDDESAKVNYNLAWTRDPALNTNLPGHQTKIDLRALAGFTDSIANGLHSFVTGDNYATIKRFYNTPFTARLENDAATRAALDLQKFNLTHFNSDPDTTYYGRSRMMLTTQLSNAALRDANGNVIMDAGKPLTRPFLDILKNPSNSTAYIEPGITGTMSAPGNVDAAKLNTVVNDLVTNYLKRSDWPMVDGNDHSLQEKYYSAYSGAARDQRLAQLALNIIDYVRTTESKRNVVQPIRAKWVSGVFTPDFANSTIQGQPDTFKGLARAPHITEMGAWVSDTPEASGTNVGRYRTVFFAEIFVPENYGIDTLDTNNTDGKKWSLYVGEAGVKIGEDPLYFLAGGGAAGNEYTVTNPRAASSPTFIWEARAESAIDVLKPGSKTKIKAGEYRTIAMEVFRTKSKLERASMSLRMAITVSGGPRIDVAPLSASLSYVLGAGAAGEMGVPSFETADPRVNGLGKDWVRVAANTFGRVNQTHTASLASPLSVSPPQDQDATGKVSSASLRMPYPYLNAKNLTGRVRSPGDLGLIHTGIEGSDTAPKPGVPWRSLRLQPSSQNTTVVPDWAFMDLFTVPVDVPVAASALFSPHSTSTGGRVNINAKPDPFELDRVDPLVAVLYGVRKSTLNITTLTLDEAKVIAQNIYNHTLASGSGSLPAGKPYPASSASKPNVYESPGEIAEIAGIADKGEETEELVREIANLITARGNVFSVYSVGQALKQTPAGKLVVTGEQRQHAVLERYLVGKGTSTPLDDSVALRTIYLRNLTP